MFAVDRRLKLTTLFTMCFALFMAMLDNTVVNVALPTIQRDFGSGVSGLQWIISAYTLFFASLMLTGGTLGDLYGRKRLFLIGLLVFSSGSLLCGLAPSLHWLVAGRAVQGIGAAALLPGTLSILITTFPDPKERAQAIGLWAGVSGLALAAGPVIGGVLVDTLGWQSVFFINVPIGVLAFLVALRTVRESSNPEGRTLDLPGQGLAVLSLGSLVYALIEANNYGWTSPLILTLFAVGIVTPARLPLGRDALQEPHAAAAVLPQPDLRRRLDGRWADQLRHVRHLLLPHALLAEHPGLLGAADGSARPAADGGHHRHGAARGADRRTDRFALAHDLRHDDGRRGHAAARTDHADHALQRALVEPADARRRHGQRDGADDGRR